MYRFPRLPLLFLVVLLALSALACSISGGSPEEEGTAAATPDQAALVAQAVATITAQLPAATAPAIVSQGAPITTDLEADLIALYERVNPSVVHIFIYDEVDNLIGTGTGFLYDNEGHIVTNNHVVSGAARLVMDDKKTNPSNYAMVTVSEGAHLSGGAIVEFGEADAYGHRKLGGIGDITGDALKQLTGENIISQKLGYLMRSGAPDALDLMVGTNYAHLAVDLLVAGSSGRMVALRDGAYTHVAMSMVTSGVKRVDVDELYDVANYRPKVRHVLGKPMFLY